jgi:hypothetical protein
MAAFGLVFFRRGSLELLILYLILDASMQQRRFSLLAH